MAVKVTVFKQSSKIREKTRKIFLPVIGDLLKAVIRKW